MPPDDKHADLDRLLTNLLCLFICGSATYAVGMILVALYLGR